MCIQGAGSRSRGRRLRRRRFELSVLGGLDRENTVVQFLAVLGLCILVVVLLVWSFSWEDGVDPSEEGIWKSTGRRRRFTRESQYAEQTSLITSAKAFYAEVYFFEH